MAADLSIIIVSWNVCDLLRDCLRSIEAHRYGLDIETIVVDSHSADDSVDMVRREFPEVVLIACDENVGFPRGNNIGLARATGRTLFLLNPDTVVIKDALPVMLRYLDQHPDVGVVGPQLRFGDGSIQSSRRRFPTVRTGMFESTWFEAAAPRTLLDDYYVHDVADDETAEVDWVMGAAMLIRREVYTAVGGMDPDYFMYSEELDWCRRIKTAGWGVVYLPTAHITHFQGKSSEQASTARHINFNRAKLRYFRKYHGVIASGWLRSILMINYMAQIVIEGGKGVLGHKRPLRWQRVSAYWKVVRSGLKPAGY